MSITYNKQGKIVLEPTAGNILGITEIVLLYFENTMADLEDEFPQLDQKELRRLASDSVESKIERVSKAVEESCRKAMMTLPEDALRRDLVGRILFHRLEEQLSDNMKNELGFSRSYIAPVLKTVRGIIGETQYNNLNEHSIRPSLEYCVVHELDKSEISWETFYSLNLVSLLLVRIKNIIKIWLSKDPERMSQFIEIVNDHNINKSHPFGPNDFQMLMKAWGVQ